MGTTSLVAKLTSGLPALSSVIQRTGKGDDGRVRRFDAASHLFANECKTGARLARRQFGLSCSAARLQPINEPLSGLSEAPSVAPDYKGRLVVFDWSTLD